METKKAKSLFQKLPNITKHQPLQYKSVFDMDNPSVDLTRDYANAKECLSKLPTAQKAEYTKCARLCFYAEPGVMPRYLTYDEIKYVKYLSAFGYKVIIGDWSCNIGLGVKPTKEMLGGVMRFFVQNCSNKINEELFRNLEFNPEHIGYRYMFNKNT